MRRQLSRPRSLAPLVLTLCVWLLWPAQSLAAALIRFIHAVPGVGTATVDLNTGNGDHDVGSIGFGQVTPFTSVRAGHFRWSLKGGGKVLASGTSTVGSGVYDIAILDNTSGSGVRLGVYRAAGAEAGTSLIRMIHAAPELGSPMFMLNMSAMADRLPYTGATPYYSVKPGVYSVSAMKPWLMKRGDPTLVDAKAVRFVPGQAYTEIVVGSRGQMVRLIRVVDRGAPLTRPASLAKSASSAPVSDEPMSNASSVVVRQGDSLWAIAHRLVGAAASDDEIHAKLVAIWDLNRKRIKSGDPNLIFPGQRLMLR